MRGILFGTLAATLTFWHATVPQSPAGTLTLGGVVLTGTAPEARPVRRAKVTLTGGSSAPRIADTDTKGTYRFERLPPGDYRVTVQKPGFVKIEAAASPNATLTMVRGGAIEGLVADPNGDPLWNVVVAALELQPTAAKPKIVAETRTDDRGQYRLHSLPEGDYLVEAATDRGFLNNLFTMPGEKLPDQSRAYFPGGAPLEAARSVHVSLGRDTAAIDVTLASIAPVKDPSRPAPNPRPDATGTARIAGRVLDATSGRPIKNAQLLLLPIEGQRITNWTRTDSQGRFAYSSLQARRYTLRAEAQRYVRLEFGQQRPGETGTEIEVRDGADVTADFKLPRASAIEGTLLDEFGDPAPGVTIQAAQRQYAAGRKRLMPIGSRMPPPVSDDLGRYRLAGLQPGEYYVAALSGAYTDMNGIGGFAPTYYPGSTDSGAAAAVAVALGADTTAAFSLVPARTLTVSGVMVDANGQPITGRGTVALATPDKLQRADFNLARGVTAPDGKFVLRNVPQGPYTVQGFGPQPPGGPGNLGAAPFGWLGLTVGDVDLDNVVLRVTDGTTLRGRITLDDTAVAPPAADNVRISTIPVEFDSAPVAGGPSPSQTRRDLTFEVTKQSGMRRIFVSVSSPNWTLKKILRNEFDITDTAIDFREKDVDDVEVVLSSKVSRITGGAADDKGAVADYALVIFASDPTRWIDRSRFVLLARPTQQGRFDVRGLPPEEYLAIALPNVVGNEWMDPEFLQQLRGQATSFVLGEGESRTLELKLKRRP